MPNILTSWKEIGQYLGKGVRTVQRWELERDLPVRRPQGRSRYAILAIPEELDLWTRTSTRYSSGHTIELLQQELAALREQTDELRARLERVESAMGRDSRGALLWPGLGRQNAETPVRLGNGAADEGNPTARYEWGREMRLAARLTRAQAIRTRLCFADTACTIGENRWKNGEFATAQKVLLWAQNTTGQIRQSLKEPDYVPLSEMGDIRAALVRLELRVGALLHRSAGDVRPEYCLERA
jgi:hypothetical protein